MSDLIWLPEARMCWIEPYFLLSQGVPWIDDRRATAISRSRLCGRDALAEYGPHKTIYNRFIR